MKTLRRTPLFSLYSQHPGVRTIDFGGWELPIQFTSIVKEHEAVRRSAGLFDVSHMGRLIVTGLFTETLLERLTTNRLSALTDGRAQYTLMCNSEGGTIDDLLIYRLSADQYMLVVNASNTAQVLEWLREQLIGDITVENTTGQTALLALQGPDAAAILGEACDAATCTALNRLAPFQFTPSAAVCGVSALVSRTGYTGEDGFELYVDAVDAPVLWNGLLQAGERYGAVPAGLGARDTLRLEARLPLYGHELSASVSPIEAGLRAFVKTGKGEFIGRSVLLEQLAVGAPRRLVGIELGERSIPRAGYAIYADGMQVGHVTSGTHSPTLKRNIGLALVHADYASIGTRLLVDVRGVSSPATVVPTPFYRRLQAQGGR
ncbi:glycine cleavage system aminomethyltransferase GcvT [Paenibacillus sp. MMS18-CY102]|uniref:glycine cleavage system aminomethyltransferase GcvT n=1 Tax=Paenibacillus sp. MMS18-CY102 TaxID=2682849 RepID=UPI0013666855|nr:glycine cleavage system aminomethyltransferase GcvT [Paenibacillus sp. MMS18-CY102]MWC27838.1 glycine cleavage system aminomethyltransferase GcvT [Paenibacillus sp. MMS18-CY102]